MATHGGYAAVLSLRQQVLQDYVDIAYGAGFLTRVVFNIDGPVQVLLFLQTPVVECRSTDGGRLRLRFRAVGSVSAHSSSGSETREVVAYSTVLVTPAIGWHRPASSTGSPAPDPVFGLHFVGGATESYSFLPFDDEPFSAESTAVIDGFVPTATAELVVGLLGALNLSSVIVPSVLGGLTKARSTTSTTIVADGAVTFAFDVDEVMSGTRITTTGNPSFVTAPPSGIDISLSVHPVAVPFVFDQFESALLTAAEDEGASLGLFGIATQEGAFAVRGRLSKSSGRVHFSFRATPQMVSPVVETRYEDDDGRIVIERSGGDAALWFSAEDVVADAAFSFWAAFLSVIVPPVGVPVAFALLNGREDDVREAIRSGRTRVPRMRRFSLGNDGRSPIITATLERFECRDDEVFAGTTFTHTPFSIGSIDGPSSIGPEDAQLRPPTFRVVLPFAVFGGPHTFVHWTVADNTTGVVHARATDRVSTSTDDIPTTFTLPADLPYLDEPTLLVSARVVRELGAITEPLFSASMTTKVRDFLDRSHPYVQWRHEVRVPSVRVEDDGTRTVQGYPLRRRVSKIHRTAIPGRCRMISRMSLNRVTDPEPVPSVAGIEYLDVLPFARGDLEANRSKICEYCFFGGPGRFVPLID